jgi:hypothetical protein
VDDALDGEAQQRRSHRSGPPEATRRRLGFAVTPRAPKDADPDHARARQLERHPCRARTTPDGVEARRGCVQIAALAHHPQPGTLDDRLRVRAGVEPGKPPGVGHTAARLEELVSRQQRTDGHRLDPRRHDQVVLRFPCGHDVAATSRSRQSATRTRQASAHDRWAASSAAGSPMARTRSSASSSRPASMSAPTSHNDASKRQTAGPGLACRLARVGTRPPGIAGAATCQHQAAQLEQDSRARLPCAPARQRARDIAQQALGGGVTPARAKASARRARCSCSATAGESAERRDAAACGWACGCE